MFSGNPANIIGEREIVSYETGLRVVTKIKDAVDADLLNRFFGWLERKLNSKSGYVDSVSSWTASSVLRSVADTKIVNDCRLKNVCPVAQEVLRLNRRPVRVDQKVGGIETAFLLK